MNSFIDQLNFWSARWIEAVWLVLWQSTLLAFVVATACWALRRHSPAVRHALWLVLAAKLLVIPFWLIPVSLPEALRPASTIEMKQAAAATPHRQPRQTAQLPLSPTVRPMNDGSGGSISGPPSRPTLPTWLMLGWAAVVLVQCGRTLKQYGQLNKLLKQGGMPDDLLIAIVADCARQVQLSRPPAVRVVDQNISPLVCGPVRPILLLPKSIFGST
jgi:beta-lactamase regulating signal transducer with metallopeptidase domain